MGWKELHRRHREERRSGRADERRQAAERAAQRELEAPPGCELTLEELDRRLCEAGLLPRHRDFRPGA